MPTLEAVKTRPILFSGAMVKALLFGAKTQTRRIIKPQPIEGSTLCLVVERPAYGGSGVVFTGPGGMDARPKEWQKPSTWSCPYGQPGDRLWVRETFYCDDYRYPDAPHDELLEVMEYRASHDCTNWEAGCPCRPGKSGGPRWNSPIHMLRWASRITLEITEVRVERLQSISEADKLAEGATPEMPFGTVWRTLHTKPGERFEDSPWVWAITFRRIEEGGPLESSP